MKNLILSLAKGYDFNTLKPFIISLEESGFKGDLVLFVSDINEKTRDILIKRGVQLVSFSEDYPYLDGFASENIPKKEYLGKMPLLSLRFVMFYLYLSKYGKSYSQIMLTDIRDVIFQKDPFDFALNEELCCFLEDKRMRISDDQRWNATWIRESFGEEVLKKIENNYISCAGIVIGTLSPIMDYLKKMVDILADTNKVCNDQAAHNYLIYTNQFENLKFFENENGPILTLAFKKEETMQFNDKGLIINASGDVVNIIHQYDRHDGLMENIKRKYKAY
ncbi:MAG: hypothetical protein HQ549_03715 [Candidatus Omnitrophica bacterium]|nr:hypothetical protein [Candidatus Omnitrophota bacterium]